MSISTIASRISGFGAHIGFREADDPTNVADTGHTYTNDVAGRTELMYQDDTGAEIQITSMGSLNVIGGGGAPNSAQYLTLATHASLTSERVFTPGTGISAVDGGANGAYTVSINQAFSPTWTGTHTFTHATAPIVTATVGPSGTQQHTLPAVTSDTVTLNGAAQTLLLKTLTTPTIASFVNATHNHQDAAGGGTLDAAAVGSGVLGVARGGTGTGTAFTTGSVIFAGASGVYSQDNGNFFWDDTGNRLLIGTSTTTDKFAQVHVQGTADPVGYFADGYGTGINPQIIGRRARGTPGTPTATQSGDFIMQVGGRGYGATGFAGGSSGRISIIANQNFTDTARGTYIDFYTTPNGSTTLTRAMVIGADGEVACGPSGTSSTAFGSTPRLSVWDDGAVDTIALIRPNDTQQGYIAFWDDAVGAVVPWSILYWGTNYGGNAIMLYNGVLGVAPWQCDVYSGYNVWNQDFLITASAHFDLNGSLGFRSDDTTNLGANQNDFDIITDAGSEKTIYRISASTPINITGFLAPALDQVRCMILINVGSNAITLTHQDAASAATNRIITPTALSVVLAANGSAMLWYDNTTDRWRIINREL